MFSILNNFNRRTFTLLSLLLILFSLPLTVLIAQKTQTLRQQAAQTCSQCIIERRSDILDLYKANGWDTSAQNYDKIVENWCSISPDDCSKEKADRCAGQCGTTRTAAETVCAPGFDANKCAVCKPDGSGYYTEECKDYGPSVGSKTWCSCAERCASDFETSSTYAVCRDLGPLEITTADARCSGSDSRIIWKWSGGSGQYTGLVLIDDTLGTDQDFSSSMSRDQTQFTSAKLSQGHNYRLQVRDSSGKQDEESETSLVCATPTPKGPTPAGTTITPTPTELCENLENSKGCFENETDVKDAFPREEGWRCQERGRKDCDRRFECWTCRLGPTPTPTPPSIVCQPSDCSQLCAPGFACLQDPDSSVKSCECRRPDAVAPTAGPTPTPTVIPAGSTVFKVRLSLQEYTRTQTRAEREPTSGRRRRPNTEVTLVLSSDKFDAKTNLVWQEKTSDGNLGFYEGTVVFLPDTLPSGTNTYDILVKERNHLRKKVAAGVTIETGVRNEALILGDVANVLTVGDVSGNNIIDLADHAILVNCFGNKSSSDECNDKEDDADLDGDGKVTIFDYNWLLENFGKEGDKL